MRIITGTHTHRTLTDEHINELKQYLTSSLSNKKYKTTRGIYDTVAKITRKFFKENDLKYEVTENDYTIPILALRAEEEYISFVIYIQKNKNGKDYSFISIE